MDSPLIADAVAKATPNVAALLDRHARWSAQMCRNVPSPPPAMFRNVPPARGGEAARTAEMFRDVPESSGRFHTGGKCKTNPIGSGAAPRPLTYRRLAAARLIVRGWGSLAIAQHLGVEHHSVARWKRDPAFTAELERLRALKTASAVAPPRPDRPAVRAPAPPPTAAPTRVRTAYARMAEPRRTKEDVEHEAMIEAYLRQHGA